MTKPLLLPQPSTSRTINVPSLLLQTNCQNHQLQSSTLRFHLQVEFSRSSASSPWCTCAASQLLSTALLLYCCLSPECARVLSKRACIEHVEQQTRPDLLFYKFEQCCLHIYITACRHAKSAKFWRDLLPGLALSASLARAAPATYHHQNQQTLVGQPTTRLHRLDPYQRVGFPLHNLGRTTWPHHRTSQRQGAHTLCVQISCNRPAPAPRDLYSLPDRAQKYKFFSLHPPP